MSRCRFPLCDCDALWDLTEGCLRHDGPCPLDNPVYDIEDEDVDAVDWDTDVSEATHALGLLDDAMDLLTRLLAATPEAAAGFEDEIADLYLAHGDTR